MGTEREYPRVVDCLSSTGKDRESDTEGHWINLWKRTIQHSLYLIFNDIYQYCKSHVNMFKHEYPYIFTRVFT